MRGDYSMSSAPRRRETHLELECMSTSGDGRKALKNTRKMAVKNRRRTPRRGRDQSKQHRRSCVDRRGDEGRLNSPSLQPQRSLKHRGTQRQSKHVLTLGQSVNANIHTKTQMQSHTRGAWLLRDTKASAHNVSMSQV